MNNKEMLSLMYAAKSEVYSFDAEHYINEKSTKDKIFKKALEFSDKALELDSLCIKAYSAKAKILGVYSDYNNSPFKPTPDKNFEKALGLIDKAISLSPEQEGLFLIKGEIYRRKGFWPCGVSALKEEYFSEALIPYLKNSIKYNEEAIKIVDSKIEKELLKENLNDIKKVQIIKK